MPEICRFYGIIISMYFNDHNPPHFHAKYEGKRALFEIKSRSMLKGEIKDEAKEKVILWANLHEEELLENWELLLQDKAPKKIKPL